MKVVLDTNVLVAGLLSPYGPPAQILQLVLMGKAQLCFDSRIMAEYRQVLGRPKFGFNARSVADLLDYVEYAGAPVVATPWSLDLPDPDDAVFLEIAKAGSASLITGNAKHFPANKRRGVSVLTPTAFLDLPQVRAL